MKPIITLFTAVLLSQAITAQTTLIPDANFEQALIDLGYDTGAPDGSVPTVNISGVTSLSVSSESISDLTGIEDFTALTDLYCGHNLLMSLDVSNNPALTYLECRYNQLTSLDVSNNTALTFLSCINNTLTSLDVSNNTALVTLWCGNNSLTSLDVSNNTALATLNCSDNLLTSLDVSNNTALYNGLDCANNQLTSLDVSNNTALVTLYCSDNLLTSLDVSNNTALAALYCSDNQLTSLDLSQNIGLSHLFCQSNQLTCLNIKNTALLVPGVDGNYTSGINNPNLTCIEVDDVALAAWFWGFDSTASFSTDCNNACSSATTGMAEYGLSFNLYPNPVTSSLVVETHYPLQLAIYNVQGKLMVDKAISSTYTMDLSHIAKGLYFLTATDEQGRVYSQKIIKE